MVITKIGALSLGKVMGVTYGLMGLLIGGCIALVSVATGGALASASDDGSTPAFLSAMFGVGAVIVLPVFYGCLGALMGMFVAAVYNVAARVVGGIEIEID